MDGVHDMGGSTERFGPLKALDPAQKAFGEPWEGRAFAVTLLANRAATSSNLHAFRHALALTLAEMEQAMKARVRKSGQMHDRVTRTTASRGCWITGIGLCSIRTRRGPL